MIFVQAEPFNPGDELNRLTKDQTDHGALVSFTGLVRGRHDGHEIRQLELEHYPGYTEAEIARIDEEAQARWPDIRTLIIHRYGRLLPGEPIVFVAVSSPHRADSFAAANFLMDYLKTDAPFWKKEYRAEGEVWIEPKQADYKARKYWAASPLTDKIG